MLPLLISCLKAGSVFEWPPVFPGVSFTLQLTYFLLFGCISQRSSCPRCVRVKRVFVKLYWLQVTEANSSQLKLEGESGEGMRGHCLGPRGSSGWLKGGGENRGQEDRWALHLSPDLLLTCIHYSYLCAHLRSLFLHLHIRWTIMPCRCPGPSS